MAEIFYVEDDKLIAQAVGEYLEKKGCRTVPFETAEEARRELERHCPDLMLLDWNLPGRDGTSLCRWVRSRWPHLPMIFLTVRDEARDIIRGLEDGADDYVTKPFELDVLYSRIRARLRSAKGAEGSVLSCGPVTLDKDRLMVFSQGQEVSVSQAEYRLLLTLMENRGRTVTRELLLEQIWDHHGNYVNDNTLTVTMKRLREKLGQPSCLRTIRSFGYRMEEWE